jgi:hypothetical protein
MPFVPHTYVLFRYDFYDGVQVNISCSYIEQHLIDLTNDENDTSYYFIYKYKEDSFHFGSTQKAATYEHYRTIKGKKNSGLFKPTPYNIAHHFENAHSWYYQTH